MQTRKIRYLIMLAALFGSSNALSQTGTRTLICVEDEAVIFEEIASDVAAFDGESRGLQLIQSGKHPTADADVFVYLPGPVTCILYVNESPTP